MDYRPMIEHHVQRAADMTVGCVEMPMQEAGNFGVMSIDDQFRITDFREKPGRRAGAVEEPTALVSMGIYVFNAEFLYRRLCLDATDDNSSHDFGRDIIPGLVGRARLSAFPFRDRVTGQPGYWRDVGTIDAYFDANMDLCEVTPRLNFYDSSWPIWTYQQQLPPAKFVFNDAQRRGIAADSIVSNGCIVSGAWVVSSVLSDNVRVNSYSTIEHSVILNNAVIGRNCHIRNAIIDSDCHVPPNTMIGLDYAEDCARFQLSPKGVVLVAAEMLKECPARLARTEQVA
jgi:glucose-1-phosphate adenylyltransferase